MVGALIPLEEIFFSKVDEKAVSDLVGCLESQLAGPRSLAAFATPPVGDSPALASGSPPAASGAPVVAGPLFPRAPSPSSTTRPRQWAVPTRSSAAIIPPSPQPPDPNAVLPPPGAASVFARPQPLSLLQNPQYRKTSSRGALAAVLPGPETGGVLHLGTPGVASRSGALDRAPGPALPSAKQAPIPAGCGASLALSLKPSGAAAQSLVPPPQLMVRLPLPTTIQLPPGFTIPPEESTGVETISLEQSAPCSPWTAATSATESYTSCCLWECSLCCPSQDYGTKVTEQHGPSHHIKCSPASSGKGGIVTPEFSTARKSGITDVSAEVMTFISRAAQTRLGTVIEKVTIITQHRMESYKDNEWYKQTTDVQSQLKFFEQLERLEKQRKYEQEREILSKPAKSRLRQEDPEQARLKQKAKEAVGAASGTQSEAVALSYPGCIQDRKSRVNLRDFIFYLEQERKTSHSLLLYQALLK